MPPPKLRDTEIDWIAQQVVSYIETQRRTFRRSAMPLNVSQRAAMQSFFPTSTLDSVGVLVLTDGRVANPPFYPDLHRMGFPPNSLPGFSLMAAITFVDTVVSHEPFSGRLLFHELVHVVQYEKLGLERFASRYVGGFLGGGAYETIPLEVNAYELDARFEAAPARAFSVADEVQKWVDANRF